MTTQCNAQEGQEWQLSGNTAFLSFISACAGSLVGCTIFTTPFVKISFDLTESFQFQTAW
jgi:hypothetical protein